ncbi:hypothetical protein BWQ96_09391 [Gracilariopsis chorda]|uniref:Uncharacterized protein n=1 Tax=Gracilariopsis chorda TaxID=448386 RepID=A0A2V3IFU2_9FLOR|nr:hypothetical protein BWQ96_09391 [Gracilariopsis chorda]|eukprot:PXF40898.1 hypothetical protein BWQ96_09391 [Gracilariopsis chorda]
MVGSLHRLAFAFNGFSFNSVRHREFRAARKASRCPLKFRVSKLAPRATAAAASPGDRADRVSPSTHTNTSTPNPEDNNPSWQSRPGVDLLLPADPGVIISFTGGFAAGLAPRTTYAAFLRRLSEVLNAAIIAYKLTSPSGDHIDLANKAASATGVVASEICRSAGREIPVFGVGHSLGAKCLLLAGCEARAREASPHAANIFISFNNASRDSALPWRPPDSKAAADALSNVSAFLTSLDISKFGIPDAEQTMKNVVGTVSAIGASLSTEFHPSSEETIAIAGARYAIHQNLILSFDDDTLDHSEELETVLRSRLGPKSVVRRIVPGTHMTPMTPDIGSEFVTTGFSAVDDTVQKAAVRIAKELDQAVAVIAAFVKLQLLIREKRATELGQ